MTAPHFILICFCTIAALCHAQQPNIVFIISDDAGFADWGFMDAYTSSVNPGQAASPVPTPNLDALRSRGVLLTNAYTASVCSPSRAAIVTGSYQQRIGYEYNINNRTSATAAHDGLTSDTVTIFDRMKSLGYTTGVVGKWHLGAMADNGPLPGNRPPRQGVDEFFGIWKGSRNYTVGGVNDSGTLRETFLLPNGAITDTVLESTAPWQGMNVTNVFGQGGVDFIDRHYQDANPFFLYLSFTAPHSPIHQSPDINDPRLAGLTGTRKNYASMVLTMDREIGRVLDKLDDPAGDGSISIADNTLVIFINDNGGASGNGTVNTPLRDWKGSPFEGGTRIPMIVAGAGVTAAPGSSYHEPVHSIDVLPTCHEAGGGATLGEIDGVSLLPFLNGSNPAQPHEFIFLRNEAEIGIRAGNWKLVKNGRGSAFQLFDLSNDLAESVNVAAANAPLIAQLAVELTKFEARSDKPRHSRLGANAGTINYHDHFALVPTGGGGTPQPTGPNLLANPGFESGTQADADSRYTFAEIDGWTNNGNADSAEVAAIANDAHSGGYRGVFVRTTRIPYQLTNHLIAGGERMLLDFWHKGKSGWDAADTITAELFYLEAANEVVLSSLTINPQPGGYQNEVHLFPAITDPNAVGKPLGIRILSNGAASEFVSIDDVSLATGVPSGGGGLETYAWSELNAWVDPGTTAAATLRDIDSFPGCVLEFPTHDSFSYVASNDLTRPTELDFMLNTLILSGSFSGSTEQSAEINGNALLLTKALAGGSPGIEITAMGADFSYEISAPLILFDGMLIYGNGTTPVEISGEIRDFSEPRGLWKTGSSAVCLSGTLSYSGATDVTGGTLLFDTPNAATSRVSVGSGTVGGVTALAGDLNAEGTVAPGLPTGTLSVAGDAVLSGTLAIELDGPAHDKLAVAQNLDLSAATLALSSPGMGASESSYVIASYGSLTGTFATVNGLPAGYGLDYNFHDGISANNIAIVEVVPTPYERWAAASGLNGEPAALDFDPNNDGVPNGIAFVLGAPTALLDSSALLPSAVLKGANYEYVFRRSDEAAGLHVFVEYGTDLLTWTSAQNGIDGVSLVVADDHFAAGIDRVTVSIPTALAPEGTLFARLVVAEVE